MRPEERRADAYGLAEKLWTGALAKRILKAPREFSALRELSRMHITVVREVVRVQARIKSLSRSRGILVAALSVYGARHREAWQQRLPASARLRAAPLYAQLDVLVEQKKQIERELLREAKKHQIVRILETAPGFGPIRSARLVPIVVTPHRCRAERQFWSDCGLGIAMRSSSDWVRRQTPGLPNRRRTGTCVLQSSPMEGNGEMGR